MRSRPPSPRKPAAGASIAGAPVFWSIAMYVKRRTGGASVPASSLAGVNSVSRAGPALVVVHDTAMAIAARRSWMTYTEPNG